MINNPRLKFEHWLEIVGERDASDLHLQVGKPPIIRIDRRLAVLEEETALLPEDTSAVLDIIVDPARRKEFEQKRELDFSYSFKGRSRYRVNAFYQMGRISLEFRLVPAAIKTVAELGLPSILEQFAKQFQGLVLVVGPSGQGKSTTLAAMIDTINRERAEHIVTIEDPIEYVFTPNKSIINQRELGTDTLSFAGALRSVLREDANVVMVGEMRDLDTIANTMTVAETGHLIFSTLHTNDAPQTVDRIIDVFPAHQQAQVRSQLANVLSGIVSQRLLPRVGGGRVAVTEVLIANNAARNLIREGKSYQLQSVIQTGAEDGMVSLDKSLAELVEREQITLENALRYTLNKDNLMSLLQR